MTRESLLRFMVVVSLTGSGSVSDTANNAMGLKYWTTSGSGGNAIAITKEHFRSGSQSL